MIIRTIHHKWCWACNSTTKHNDEKTPKCNECRKILTYNKKK